MSDEPRLTMSEAKQLVQKTIDGCTAIAHQEIADAVRKTQATVISMMRDNADRYATMSGPDAVRAVANTLESVMNEVDAKTDSGDM